MPPTPVCGVFAYGTLKRGQCRQRYWPRQPVRIVAATIRGRLYDLGPFPALLEGSDVIEGELWQFAPGDMEQTLAVLDEVEQAAGEGRHLYERRVVYCTTAQGDEIPAWVYFLANPSAREGAPLVVPSADGRCRWPP